MIGGTSFELDEYLLDSKKMTFKPINGPLKRWVFSQENSIIKT